MYTGTINPGFKYLKWIHNKPNVPLTSVKRNYPKKVWFVNKSDECN